MNAQDPGMALLAARSRAVAESGWGARFRLFQPRNLAFWVYLFLVAFGVFVSSRAFALESPVYGGALLVAAVLFGLYGALFWWFTTRIDRYAHQSRVLIVLAFLWGAFAATFTMAAQANTPIQSLWAKAFGQAWSIDWGAGLTAPFTEELAKGSGLLLLMALAPRLVRTAFDGFVLGAFIGLGFQILEDIQYALSAASEQFGANPVQNALSTIVLRMGVGVGAHILYSAVFCTGLVYLLGRPAEPRRRLRGLTLMASAMLLHGLWDDLGAFVGAPDLLPVMWVVVIGIAFFVVTRAFNLAIPRERQYMRAVLAPEAASGVVTREELETLSGDRRARRRYRREGHGRHDKQRRAHLLEAAHDLADELASAGGEDTARVGFARSELARLRSLPFP
jgi:RsiW-degrading membrane proteinase PrsW (M82 family)